MFITGPNGDPHIKGLQKVNNSMKINRIRGFF
jgi:hypothetical protein